MQGPRCRRPTAGVAALVISRYGDFQANNRKKPQMSPTTVEQHLWVPVNNQPCPTPRTVVQGPVLAAPTATCQGDTSYNDSSG
jgi:hypothetical protein